MKRTIRLMMAAALLIACLSLRAQQLEVAVTKTDVNKVQIIGTATSPGFSTAPTNAWSAMNLTWRIPKTAAMPQPTVAPPATTPEVTGEASLFTGASPRDAFNGGLDLAIFDLTAFGYPDDGYWYFQVTGTTEEVQNIATGNSVVLYEFTVPSTWACSGCVELLTTEVQPGLPISTASFVDNAGTGADVLQIAVNNAPLPVSWLYIKADPKLNNTIQVSWGTAMEQKNAGFNVERSEDGQHWRSIASVAGKVNSVTPSHYSIEDADVIPGVNYYYHIRQTDLDGRVRYSATVRAMISGNTFLVRVNPNPVKDRLNIELQSSKQQYVQVMITDIAGKLYQADNRYSIGRGTTVYSRSVMHYPAGTYVAKVIAGDGTVRAVKFIIE